MKRGVKKNTIILVSAIALFFLVGALVYAVTYGIIPNPGHGGDKVWINVSKNVMLLQDAIDQKKLVGTLVGGGLPPSAPSEGHLGNQIWVKVSGSEGTLQAKINSGSLCSNSVATAYTQPAPNPGHYATEVIVKNASGYEKTLQQLIDAKEFCAPCKPESDYAFCYYYGKNCGSYTNKDNCGNTRTADCGSGSATCSGGQQCNSNVCTPICTISQITSDEDKGRYTTGNPTVVYPWVGKFICSEDGASCWDTVVIPRCISHGYVGYKIDASRQYWWCVSSGC